MRWHDVLVAIGQAAATDEVLMGIYGSNIRMAGKHKHVVPALDYRLITDTEQEQWAPHIVQFDQWTNTLDELAASDRRLRFLFNQDVPVQIGELYTWAVFTEGADLVTPDDWNYFGRGTRFRFTPLREQYVVAIP